MPYAQAAVPRDIGVFEWLFDPGSWTGRNGILTSLGDTVVLCSIVVVIASVTMIPLAAWLAHTRRGEVSVSWMVTLSRAIPTFAVAGLLVPISLRNGWGFEPWPIFIALLLLALPPIFLNTYTAIRQVSPGVVEAARAMGYSESDVLFRVELALGTAVILDGVRVAAITVVATEPIRAFLGGDGLGRYVREEGVLRLEEAVRKMTSAVADRIGLRDRGLLRAGMAADVTIFDPERIGSGDRPEFRNDLPGGGKRLVMASQGVHYTIVNGAVLYEEGHCTAELPGQILRSGSATP